MFNWPKFWNITLGMADPINRGMFWAGIFWVIVLAVIFIVIELFINLP